MNNFKYGMKYRPYSIGCQPMENLKEVLEDTTGQYYNILVYSQELTPEEVNNYQLIDLQPKPDLKKALIELYKALNKPLLKDINNYTRQLAKDNNRSFNLYTLITEYTRTHENNTELLEYINELKENNSISSMVEYYELTDFMLTELLEG